jgi:adenosylmethionine-8-amino-7-oxononanoate aminotransferase
MFGGLAHEQALTLASRIAALLPGELSRIFFSESGSVAVEVAMKMAVQFWINRGQRRRTRFVAFKGGYHGDTTGAMSVCDPEVGMHAMFRGLLPEHFVIDLPTDEEGEIAFAQSSSSRSCKARVAWHFMMPTCSNVCVGRPIVLICY